MATLVKFLKKDDEIFAFFPQLNYNKRLYGNEIKTSYAHIGQHSACAKEYANEAVIASKEVSRSILQVGSALT